MTNTHYTLTALHSSETLVNEYVVPFFFEAQKSVCEKIVECKEQINMKQRLHLLRIFNA